MMVSPVDGNRLEVGDLESVGVRLEERARLVGFCENLMRLGLSEFEVQPALQLFIQNQKCTAQPQWSRYGIIQSAKEAIRKANETAAAAKRAAQRDTLQVISMADVTPEPVRWLWPGRIPLGKVSVVYGDVGVGKTCWALDLAARVSAGLHWPDDASAPDDGADGTDGDSYSGTEAGKVLVINSEDHLHEMLSPRLISGGARMLNVAAIPRISTETPDGGSEERPFNLCRDIPLLRQQIEQLQDVRLVIIDSLQAACGVARPSSWRMRALLAELGKVAEDYDLAVVVISAGHRCELPVKHVWRIDCDVLDPAVRWLVPVRSSSGALAPGLAFRVTATGLDWDSQAGVLTPDRVRGADERPSRTCRLSEVAVWLKEYLTQGRSASTAVLKAGAAVGWSAWQIKRAKLALGITCYKEPLANGRWIWEMPRNPNRPISPTSPAAERIENVVPPAGEVPEYEPGVVVRKFVPNPAAFEGEDPLAWLDRASQGIGIRIPPLSEYTRLEGSKGSEGSERSGELSEGDFARRGAGAGK